MTKSTPTCLQAATPIANDERFALMFALFGRSEGDGVYGPLLLKHIRISYRLLMSSRQGDSLLVGRQRRDEASVYDSASPSSG